jgi:hypothetical protein
MNLPRRGGVHRFRQILYQRHDKAHFTAFAADRASVSVIERFAVGFFASIRADSCLVFDASFFDC